MTIDHLRQECMVPSPLSRKRGSSPSAVSENLVLSRNPERKREREKKKLENQPFQNENQDLSNCLFWYYLKDPSKSPTMCGCRNMLVCRRNTVKHRRRHLCLKMKWKRSSEKKVLSLWNFEIFYSNNVIIYSRCSKLIHSPLSLTWMFYKQSQVIVIKAKH